MGFSPSSCSSLLPLPASHTYTRECTHTRTHTHGAGCRFGGCGTELSTSSPWENMPMSLGRKEGEHARGPGTGLARCLHRWRTPSSLSHVQRGQMASVTASPPVSVSPSAHAFSRQLRCLGLHWACPSALPPRSPLLQGGFDHIIMLPTALHGSRLPLGPSPGA